MTKHSSSKFLFVIFGLASAFIFLEISLWTAGFALNTLKNFQNKKNKDPNTITILCLGESTTYAQWPLTLKKILNEKFKDKQFNVIDCGKPGLTTDFFVHHIKEYMQKYYPDFVVFMIGINDHGLGYKKYPFKAINLLQLIYEHLKIKFIIYDHTSLSYDRLDSYALQLWQNGKYAKAEQIYLKLFKKSSYKNNFAYLQLIQLYNVMLKSGKSSKYEEKFIALITDHNLKMTFGHLEEIEKFYIDYRKDKSLFKSWIIKNKNKIEYSDKTALLLKKYGCSDIAEDIKKNIFKYDVFFKTITYNNEQVKEQSKKNYRYIARCIWQNNPETIIMPMQYPVISVENLKNNFKNLKNYDKLVFISNEENFKKALLTRKNEEIFIDMFAGSFGHCTDYGNYLIAENVAETVKKIIQ